MSDEVRILDGTTFMVTGTNGDVDASLTEAVGLFENDTRFLSRWLLTVNGQRLAPLSVDNLNYFEARFFLVPGAATVYVDSKLSVIRERWLCDGLCEDVTILNHADEPIDLTVRVEVGSDFADIFEIKNASTKQGRHYARVEDNEILLGYKRSNFSRETRISTTDTSAAADEHGLTLAARIDPHGSWTAHLKAILSGVLPRAEHVAFPRRDRSDMEGELTHWLSQAPQLECTWEPLNDIYKRSLVDLAALQALSLAVGPRKLLFAGLPWFMATFGRDSILTSFQALPFAPQLAEVTLRMLSIFQGNRVDDFRDEDPGRILHELRRGETVAFEEQPQLPYYGSADATPLYVVLLDEYERWTGDAQLVCDLEYEARAALRWIDDYADLMGNGYIAYQRRNEQTGLENQCWKDSWDSISYHDGRLPGFPRATCELQGYAYDAKVRGARLARTFWNDPELADRLDRQAAELRIRFNRDFWIADRQYFALALAGGDGDRVDALSSNIGHLLWSGIVEPEKADPIVAHLMSDRLFSGWGVRTLAVGEGRYNPIGYHVGTVWPFDNSFIALGLRRYGYEREAAVIAAGILDAAALFEGRLPEAFAGYDRNLTKYPVEYPTACSPQAWSTGAPLLLLRSMLGLEPADGNLAVNPALPVNLGHLRLLNIPGRWGRADAQAHGPEEVNKQHGLRPQLGIPEPHSAKPQVA
jgi:glycogen debranching enzyme